MFLEIEKIINFVTEKLKFADICRSCNSYCRKIAKSC